LTPADKVLAASYISLFTTIRTSPKGEEANKEFVKKFLTLTSQEGSEGLNALRYASARAYETDFDIRM